jgi:hypothetical protein
MIINNSDNNSENLIYGSENSDNSDNSNGSDDSENIRAKIHNQLISRLNRLKAIPSRQN